MKNKTVIGFLIAFVSAAFYTVAADAHIAEIRILGDAQYKSLQLSPWVYNAANPDLSDLRIVNSKSEAVPYFIHSSLREATTENDVYEMILLDSYVKYEDFYFDYKLREERTSDTVATSMTFATGNRDFAKTVEIYGSHDNLNWEFIQNDKLYSIDGTEKLRIDFSEPQRFTHYRLRLANNQEQISFNDVRLVYDTETVSDSYFISAYTPVYGVASENKQTKITVEGVKNLRLLDVEIFTDSMFKRTVTSDGGGRKELYNLTFDNASWSDTVLPLGGYKSADEPFVITIEDGDDRPIEISDLLVRYYADELVFEAAPGESYTLEFGNAPDATPPVYDIARYQREILASGEIEKAALGAIQYAASEPEPPAQVDYSLVFNIVVVGVAVLLAGVILVLMLRKK